MKFTVVSKYGVRVALCSLVVLAGHLCVLAQDVRPFIKPEQHRIEYRHPSSLPPIGIQQTQAPPTVADPQPDREVKELTLDEAISIALQNSEVVRVLAGTTASSSGRTVYDAAIQNTTIDDARARFDPQLTLNQSYDQNETPDAEADPMTGAVSVSGSKTSGYSLRSSVSQRNMSGAVGQLSVDADPRKRFGVDRNEIERNNPYSTTASYTQPLLAGAGIAANRVPIVLARLETERSYFQFNDSIQELVRGVIDAYWSLVFARTDVWARKIQTTQSQTSLKRSEARMKTGLADITETAQVRATFARFNATLIAAEANVLTREAALQNILGLPPNTSYRIVPITTPTTQAIEFDWNNVVRLAVDRRPNLIELKLVLEADRQRLLRADNQAKPQLDAVALYRWDGLQGRFRRGREFGTGADDHMDWSLGVNFSVPLYLRTERAQVRSAQLVIARDKANIDQAVHQARHQLAQNARNLATFYAQWEAFKDARQATKDNLKRQIKALAEGLDNGSPVFLNFLNALTDWGNSVSQEAQALAQYNTELANLERQTGTILETHGVVFNEDRFCSIGPRWWEENNGRQYPRNLQPSNNQARYGDKDSGKPSEEFFELDDFPKRGSSSKKKANPGMDADEKVDNLKAPEEVGPTIRAPAPSNNTPYEQDAAAAEPPERMTVYKLKPFVD